MPKGLLIKGSTTAIIRYDEDYALDERFEVLDDVAAYLKSLGKPKRKPRKKVAVKPAAPSPDPELDEILAGIPESGEENDR